jgi:hypothetical protein
MNPKTPHPSTRRRSATTGAEPKAWLLGGLLALAAVAVLAWAFSSRGPGAETAAPAAGDDPGVSHVHGLGINPADDALFVATHYGMFRIAGDGPAERVGDSFQDTMGFTVVGPDHFLGSGHPDLNGTQAGLPGRLGLIESTDAGGTWEPVSLLGEADFHGLVFAHDQVYGMDSGTGAFMVSADQEDWETRSTLDLFGFAVDPDDADHIVGAAPDGLVESTDGGRTWAPADGPPIVALAWDATIGLWGVDPDGTVSRIADGEWEEVGALPGAPQALLATADGLYAAAVDDTGATGIYRATDGTDWQLLYQDDAR